MVKWCLRYLFAGIKMAIITFTFAVTVAVMKT